jgi:hypothetical protein
MTVTHIQKSVKLPNCHSVNGRDEHGKEVCCRLCWHVAKPSLLCHMRSREESNPAQLR